ncbi:MAG: FtsQ-type POTRA domain-containing protein [Collinsella sp.]|nr:FtsQ-type POTRA domain-containing protein [Collinsella sp.]
MRPQKPAKPTKRKPAPAARPQQAAPSSSGARRRPGAPASRPRVTVSVPPARPAVQPQLHGAATAPRRRLSTLLGGLGSVLAAPARLLAARPGAASADAARPRRRWGRIALIALALVVALAGGFIAVANSSIFAATDIQIQGGVRVTKEEVEAVLSVPDNTTLLNVDTAAISASAQKIPWVSGVRIERRFPHTLVITPEERTVAAIVYIASDDVAWAISDDGTWIAPLTVAATVDADGNPVKDPSSVPEGTQLTSLTGADAALELAREAGAVLITDVASGVAPVSGQAVDSDVIKAGLAYATGFSADFLKQVKDISVPSVEAISIHLTSGVEVSLGAPENIETKERVVTKLLAQEENVTYINVRTPDAYTFRSAQTG